MKNYKNSARPIIEHWGRPIQGGEYGFADLSPYFYMFSGLFQRVIAQCGTKLLTGHWMKTPQNYAIYKCEGGCRIEGVGDLVLGSRSCYFDYDYWHKDSLKKISGLITEIVLNFDPNNPVESIIDAAAGHIKADPDELKREIEKCSSDPFSGNALSSFFDHNPFSESLLFKIQDYERDVRIEVFGENPEEVDKDLAARNSGKELLCLMRGAIISRTNSYVSIPLCCSPRIQEDGEVYFWINTGRSTCIDGWKTEDEILEFVDRIQEEGLDFYLKSDKARY